MIRSRRHVPMLATACFLLALDATGAAAQLAESERNEVRVGTDHVLDIVAIAGWYDGVGAGVQVGGGTLALRLTGAYFPLILFVSEAANDPGDLGRLELLHTAQGNADLVWYFHGSGRRARIGLSAGYRYNHVLEHGAGLAFQGRGRLSGAVDFIYVFGLSLHPSGNEGARDELGTGGDFNFPFGAGFQGGAGLGLLFGL